MPRKLHSPKIARARNAELLGRLTPQQWQDAFRAGGYQPDVANRVIANLKEKIAQGRSIVVRAADGREQ